MQPIFTILLIIVHCFFNIFVNCLEPIRILPTVGDRTNLPADGFTFMTSGNENGENVKQNINNSELVHKEENEDVNQNKSTIKPNVLEKTTSRPPTTITLTTKPSHYRSCLLRYIPSSCKKSKYCGTKKMCVQITGDPCCAPADGECPTSVQLDIRCVKGNPINWCDHHTDCARHSLCCDTGCGYNICVERS